MRTAYRLAAISVILVFVFASPQSVALASGNSAQIAFRSGYACGGKACYIYSLTIEGTNQNNQSAYYPWVTPYTRNSPYNNLPLPVYGVQVYNWWWKPDRNIHLSFDVNGYGMRSCNVNLPKPLLGYGNWVIITYMGSNTCSIRNASSPWE